MDGEAVRKYLLATLSPRVGELSRRYEAGHPYPHIVLDNFLPSDVADELLSAYPAPSASGWNRMPTDDQRQKFTMSDDRDLPSPIRLAIQELNARYFVRLLRGDHWHHSAHYRPNAGWWGASHGRPRWTPQRPRRFLSPSQDELESEAQSPALSIPNWKEEKQRAFRVLGQRPDQTDGQDLSDPESLRDLLHDGAIFSWPSRASKPPNWQLPPLNSSLLLLAWPHRPGGRVPQHALPLAARRPIQAFERRDTRSQLRRRSFAHSTCALRPPQANLPAPLWHW